MSRILQLSVLVVSVLVVSVLVVSGVLLWTPGPAFAQSAKGPASPAPLVLAQAPIQPIQPGQVRVQGRPLTDVPAAPLPVPAGLQADLRQQMRKFIQSISAYARRLRPSFSVLTRGALELIIKRDPVDETRIFPSRAYIRSIDGVIQEGLFYREKPFSTRPSEERQLRDMVLTGMAKSNGLRVMIIDYGAAPRVVDDSRARNRKLGFLSTTLHAPMAELGSLPPYPRRPFGENSKSINSLQNIANFAFITNSAAFGRPDEFALKMRENNFDLLVVDVYHGRKPLSRRAVETLKYKKIGARRLVFATMDIGSAASYRYYWKGNWREGSPSWINAPVRDDPDRYYVQFWRPEWQRLITGDTKSYIYGIIAQGFDGVVLEGAEKAYRFFEGGGEEEEEEAPAPAAALAPTTPPGPPATQ